MTVVKFLLIGLITLYLILGACVYLLQEKFIFLPEKLSSDYPFEFDANFEEYNIPMNDGATINALHFKSDSSKGLMLYFHGNAGSLRRWGEVVIPFIEYGYDVLIVDYRGYGKSTGNRSKGALLSDAEQIYEFARTLEKRREHHSFWALTRIFFCVLACWEKQSRRIDSRNPFL